MLAGEYMLFSSYIYIIIYIQDGELNIPVYIPDVFIVRCCYYLRPGRLAAVQDRFVQGMCRRDSRHLRISPKAMMYREKNVGKNIPWFRMHFSV